MSRNVLSCVIPPPLKKTRPLNIYVFINQINNEIVQIVNINCVVKENRRVLIWRQV